MAHLIERGKVWEVVDYRLHFDSQERPGSGYSFPCDELGFVEWQQMQQGARESYRLVLAGALGPFHRPYVAKCRTGFADPDLYACSGGCGAPVEVHRFDREVPHCEKCLRRLRQEFPQGWRHYPGDVCEHGVYVGGCGIDWLCGRCEGGA